MLSGSGIALTRMLRPALCALAAAAAAAAAAPPPFRLLPASSAPPLPTPQQLKYQGAISALIHFGM